MSTSNIERWVSITSNIGVLIGIIFLVIEIRTNTESNIISMQEARAGQLVELNLSLASEELAEVWVKAEKGEELSEVEEAQMTSMWRANLSQANLVRRLFDRGVATDDELAEAWRGIRGAAQENKWVRSGEFGYSESYRILIFDEDGIEKYAQLVRRK